MSTPQLSERQRDALTKINTGDVTRTLGRYSHGLHPRPVNTLIDSGLVKATPTGQLLITGAGRKALAAIAPAIAA